MRKALFALILVIQASGTLAADSIDKLVDEYLKATHTPGMALAIVKNGKVVRAKGYGLSNLELATKVTPETVFEIGSVTKMFTSVLILQLVGEGKLSLDDPVSKYLDNLPEAWRPATIRQCLSHTSGIPDYLARAMNQRLDYTKEEILNGIAQAKMDFPFGSSWSYSNTGFYLAGMIIEKLTREEYGEVLKKKIFDPLGMTQSALYRPSRIYKNRASGYISAPKRTTNAEVIRPNSGYAAGSIVSTVTDLAKWVDGIRNNKLISEQLRNEMFTPIRLTTGRTYPYGFGWDVETLRNGSQYIGHGGNTYGCSAFLSTFPNENVCVITLCNNAGLSMKGLNQKIAEVVAPSLVALKQKGGIDPNPARTQNLRRAIASLLKGAPDPEFVDQEMLGMLASVRGKLMMTSLNGAFAKIKSLEFLSQQPSESDFIVWCSGTFEKIEKPIPMKLLVSKDGKLVRIEFGD